ncbi:unnamed protein product [Oncorhynchus mykiss]|uniref:Transcription initiation factor IIF subunit alpha n=1 Tax=Oncorhynchus mykiss TaxID=8022 RepID=A0A060YIV5_ONCMY|nr:unnamed protein product [Oncorhynchus mykiss]
MASLGGSSSSSTEYIVRVPKNTSKKYSIMAFNSGDKVNCSSWTQVCRSTLWETPSHYNFPQ